MQRVLHGGRRFWIIQLNYIKEELARTDIEEVTEAYSVYTDTHTVCKRNTVYERSIRSTTDILLLRIATTATITVTTATATTTNGYCDFIPVCYVSEHWCYSIKLRYVTFQSLLFTKIQVIHVISCGQVSSCVQLSPEIREID